jgi:hypothetical protein
VGSARFRHLERGDKPLAEGEAEAAPEAAPGAPGRETADGLQPAAARARSLERDGEIRLDESPSDTDFCRFCRFENRAGMPRCLNCGSPLGGPEQESFDEEMRARREESRERARDEGAEQGPETAAVEEAPARPALPDLDVAEILRAAERDAPGFGTVIGAGVLASCIFALVAIPVRRIFAAAQGSIASGGFELLILVAITAALYASVRRRLSKL